MGAGVWSAWSAPGLAVMPLCAAVIVYLRGWNRLRRVEPWRWSVVRPVCFVAGVALIGIALWSPLDALASRLLTAHMTQHMLLAMVAPPLLLLGWPFSPLLLGLPQWISRDLLGPLLGSPGLQRAARWLVHPPVAWIVAVVTGWVWHFPFAYEWALQSDRAHALEHACFLWSGVLFWWPVIEPWPWKGTWPRWSMAFYLLTADVANTLVAAILAFAPGAIYGVYRDTAPAMGVDALVDQQRAAVIMWLPGSLLYLVPAVVIIVHALSRKRPRVALSLPVVGQARRAPWDATRVTLLGALLRSANGRLAVRFVMLGLAAMVVLDGLLGPRDAATNIAGTWPWTHWRGMAAVGMVVAGNLACLGCPLIAPRTLLRRWITPTRRWPSWLRTKWIAAVAVLAWLVAYEAFGWWDSPLLTAGLIIGLLVMATVVDLLFEGAAFCQWMCPIGQWNMVMSVASPTQVTIRDPQVCERCTTQDCLRGGPQGPGCGTSLFLPRKVGALDCTACMDCVTACPHDNAGVLLKVPFMELQSEASRSVIGRWIERADLAALLLVLACGALVNAALMTEPIVAGIGSWQPLPWRGATVALIALLAMLAVALPVFVAAIAGAWLRGETLGHRLARMAFDLLPIGVGMWLVHFGFHLVTGWSSALPPLQRAARDGVALDLGEPAWAANCCAQVPQWLLPVMLCVLGVALLVSLQLSWNRAARVDASGAQRSSLVLVRWLPDALVALIWWALAAWIVLQPMQMRGLLS